MGYQALLFCPDEKTARTVTQVLVELEFNVESCMEPFAAVKKLMGEHFDAVVVDCDNEQNATLLFKSARNSTSNQASLAVAVVEGQAGVAKAFRIGANLVLTKPINVEQAKGTLRVARGLLRKGEPAKPAATAVPTVASVPAPAPSPTPVKPVTGRSVLPPRRVAPAAISTPRPVVPPPAPLSPAWPAQSAAASSMSSVQDKDLPEINVEETVSIPAPPAQVAPPSFSTPAPFAPLPKLPASSTPPSIEVTSGFSSAPPASPAATFGGGAASAAAPAREAHAPRVTEAPSPTAAKSADSMFDQPAEAVRSETPSTASNASSFTFGGSNVPAESSGGSKKILIGVAAALIVAVGLYFGWAHFQASSSQPVSTQTATTPAPVAPSTPVKPSSTQPGSASTTSAVSPISQPTAPPVSATPATHTVADDSDAAPDNSTAAPSKKPNSASSVKPATAVKPSDEPLVVKGGAVPVMHTKSVAADAPAPSIIGIAGSGSGGALPNLVNSQGNAPQPVLQKLNVSQGVSQGLLLKKVPPSYPANALRMRVEGSVDLLATVSKTGNITSVKILSGEALLTRAAADAVKQWKYKPYLLNGEPVEIQTQVTINFKLPH